MILDIEMLKSFYDSYSCRVKAAKQVLSRPMTYAEKVLYAHLFDNNDMKPFSRGESYVNFRPDRVAMQDATAQMALLQFMNAGKRALRPLDSCRQGCRIRSSCSYGRQQRGLRLPEVGI
mgnify:CR=1 FL=1